MSRLFMRQLLSGGLFFASSFVPCSFARAKNETSSRASSVEHLYVLEGEYTKLEDHNGDRAQLLGNQLIPEAAKDTVWLKHVGYKSVRSELISLCKRLEGKRFFECRTPRSYPYADDSIHITETRLGEVVPVLCGKMSTLVDIDGKPAPGLLRVGIGESGDMHTHGYSNITEAELLPGSSFRIPCRQSINGEMILFAVFEDALGYRKHTWIASVAPRKKK